MGNREHLDKLKARTEEVYDEMYEASGPSAAGAYFSEVKEILSTAIKLAQDMGLAHEARDIHKGLEHIRAMYDSQMQ